MLPIIDRFTRTLLIIFVASALAIGCSSSPEAEDEPAPSEPAEPIEEDDEPFDEPPAEEDADPPAPPVEPEAHEPIEVDDEALDAAVDITIATSEFADDFDERLREAESQEEAQQIEQEFIDEVEEEAEAAGLSFEEYEQIMMQIGQDPELRQQFEQKLDERGKGDLLQPHGR